MVASGSAVAQFNADGSAVLLSGPAASPHVVDSRRVDLSDPAVPGSRQPYHEGFGTEVERDLGAQILGHAYQDRVVRRRRDCKVQRRVGKPRLIAVRGIGIGLNRRLHYGDVALCASHGCRTGNHWLDQSARIENVFELAPVRDELAAHMIG
jgi:hypothetical protein